ncbi:disease resistance-like protein DSC1 isoform X2 [Malus domestica]|uniref:disease resistance-like protein DSC1 isoform X2 n=1 Tax=Malus domestica TaxID=3750 RepID=UPI0039764C1D
MASSSKDDSKYDVYLSSGGEDTRRTFTDHLYCSLKDHRVNVFMYGDEYDDKLEESNGAIPEHLIQAIERSKVAVVVFSRGYPESLWCLKELVKIMECRETLGQMFFPIFFDVDPSDVRKQSGSFAQAFQKYEQKINEDKVCLWRKALWEAGVLAGLNFRETDGHEGNFIRNVISQITGKQSITTSLEVPTNLVGIDSRVREISKHLNVEGSNDIRTIGVLGMCGLGKTTVAKAIFNKHHHNFDGASFLQKVREKKLVDLQEQLLSDILKPAYKVVSCIDEGTKEIEQRLGNRRVLVVIDDLDSVEQIDALAIKPDSFGPGSRIIITSRNEHLLRILNVYKICPLPAMNEREALELLSLHAFRKNYPHEEYVELSRKAVGYCGGLPLALEVLGSYLCSKSTSEWETVLDKWKRSQPYWEIHKRLEISYDGLTDDDVKAIFLDISCFFAGMNKDYVMTVLDGCQFYPEIGIRELQDQCLVTVDKEGNLMMHDLIQGMGREIVRAESPDNPGERSRLWHNEDITDVLTKQSGTEDVEGLALDMQESDECSFSSELFRNMQSLRLLKLNNIKLTGSYDNLSKELRWLCWHGFPLEVIPKDFDQPNLVAIDLSYSKLIRVWEDSDLLLEKLKLLNLSHSPNLAQTPDFSRLPNLEEVILNDCESLSEVHSSIGNLERLTLVNLDGCKNLKDLPLNFFNSKSIETLLLNGCSRFENLAEGLGKSYQKTADGTPIRQILRLSFSSQYVLKESPSTSLLPPSLHGINYLRKLDLGCCTLTDDKIPKDLGSLISLEDLDLRKNSFCSLPSLSGLSKLETLCLDDCTNLHAIPNLPTNLKVLRAGLCTALETMPDFSELLSMRELYLSHSCKLTDIPGLDKSLNSMTRIHMEGCINLTADFRNNILQGWTSCGYGGIFFNGNYLPDWFDFVKGDLVSFHVPPIVGRSFSGLTLCCIYSSKEQREGPLGIIISNKTKCTAVLARITYASVPTSCTLDDHYLWQGHISNYVLSLQGGDKVDIFVKPVEPADASVSVKEIGVNLVWDNFMKENMHDSDLLLYDFGQHPDWLLGAHGYEGISRELKSNYLDVARHPVGIDSRVQEISNYLDVVGSNDVRVIGIWGMGGLGKTTVAKAVFNKHHGSFDGASFLPNVRKEKKLVHSQNKLLSDILGSGNMKVSSDDEGTKEIKRRLGNKRVLVIVDDVDSHVQLNALGISGNSFGRGSRIIITTRDQHLLRMFNVDAICPVQGLNDEEALELLSWYAFGKSYPNEEYVELSRKALGDCGGVALALQVLGSYLCTRSKNEWETELDKWKRHRPREIHRRLKISYDGLNDRLKDVFLDIGCFFIGMNENYVETILDDRGLYPVGGIRELQDKCLVTVDTKGDLMMHNLIRDMAREIVYAQSPDHPGKRSRLWHHADVKDVLGEKSGTEDVEGLALDMQESDECSFSTEAFRKMQSLRLLKLNNIKLTGSYQNLSKELRWLCWHGFPLEVIPEDFDQPNLVAVDLSYSKLIRVWEDTDVLLKNLKIINLSHSHYLTESPDLSKVPNLEKLILVKCVRLSKIHPSIGHLERLSLVNLEDCETLQYFPGDFCKSKSVETLILKGCTGLTELKDKGEMVSSTTLQASHTMTRKLPSLIAGLKNLGAKLKDKWKMVSSQRLQVSHTMTTLQASHTMTRELPSSIVGLKNLISLPPSLHCLNSLTYLGLGNCGLIDDAIPKDLGSLFSLEILDLAGNLFYSLPSLSQLSKLKMLDLSCCIDLHEIPDLPTNLEILRANECIALEKMPTFSEMSSMVELHLNRSPELVEILGLHKWLNTMRRIHMEGCTNLTAAFRKNIIQEEHPTDLSLRAVFSCSFYHTPTEALYMTHACIIKTIASTN